MLTEYNAILNYSQLYYIINYYTDICTNHKKKKRECRKKMLQPLEIFDR